MAPRHPWLRLRWSEALFLLALLLIATYIVVIQLKKPMQTLVRRYPGDSHSQWTRDAAAKCNASHPDMWGYGACSLLVSCTLGQLEAVYTSDMTIGTTILGLLPTILSGISIEPVALVKLALVAPHRALAVAAFNTSNPTSVFGNLHAMQFPKPGGHSRDGNEDHIQTLTIPLACFASSADDDDSSGKLPWRHIAGKLAADIAVLVCASVMLWRNWLVNKAVMVQWMCEAPLMVFTWPLACMAWVVVAVLLLFVAAEEVRFEHATRREKGTYRWWQVLLLPYTLDVDRHLKWQRCWYGYRLVPRRSSGGPTLGAGADAIPLVMLPAAPTAPPHKGGSHTDCEKYALRVVITMPANAVLRTWPMYVFIISVLALAIYFYATFVLLSSLFLGSVSSMRFAAQVSALFFVSRVIVAVF